MANIRLIARLDIKAPNLIKGIHLEGLRVVGDPAGVRAVAITDSGADELIYMDTVASLLRTQQPRGARRKRQHAASLCR